MGSNLKIAIVGGSIAGCSNALAMKELGHDVQIFERSTNGLIDRGSGIVMPQELLEKLKRIHWVDEDAPCLPISSMRYTTPRQGADEEGYLLWERPMGAVAWRWGHLFKQLRKRINDHEYHSGTQVTRVELLADSVKLELNGNSTYRADLVIFADGLYSRGRQIVSAGSSPEYAGYVLWRGLLPEKPHISTIFRSNTVLWHPFQGGLAGSYYIPSEDGQCLEGKRTLNWGVYQKMPDDKLKTLLPHYLQSGSQATHAPLSNSEQQELWLTLHRYTPSATAEALCEDPTVFLQPIVDVCAQRIVNDRMILTGDAAAVLRPHTASGAVKAIDNALTLKDCLSANNWSPATLLDWQNKEMPKLRQQAALAKALGDGYILNAPVWHEMTPENMEHWWEALLAGKDWYLK